MRSKIRGTCFLLLLTGSMQLALGQARNSATPPPEAPRPAEHGVVNFLLPVERDAVLQHSKETYVLFGCAYCHGVDLRVRNGEASDLLRSNIVGADADGSVIMGILRNGIPQTAKLSPMPQFADLSEADMRDIARWIHYSRMQERFKEVMKADDVPGDSAAGKLLYEKSCASCHAADQMAHIVQGIQPADLKAAVLKPGIVTEVASFKVGDYNDANRLKGRSAHSHYTENANAKDVSSLIAYLKMLK